MSDVTNLYRVRVNLLKFESNYTRHQEYQSKSISHKATKLVVLNNETGDKWRTLCDQLKIEIKLFYKYLTENQYKYLGVYGFIPVTHLGTAALESREWTSLGSFRFISISFNESERDGMEEKINRLIHTCTELFKTLRRMDLLNKSKTDQKSNHRKIVTLMLDNQYKENLKIYTNIKSLRYKKILNLKKMINIFDKTCQAQKPLNIVNNIDKKPIKKKLLEMEYVDENLLVTQEDLQLENAQILYKSETTDREIE
ncbi:hypothetical protein A3Q56_07838 [Intoshia linei]|uniref:Uncharacterized protein n=1 Tax=Intoshia linei TaxID=1819745 RepID=A0A177AR52_9BILA|nr:hypothetical protein A3Q56_07838 [Intoshia linei]